MHSDKLYQLIHNGRGIRIIKGRHFRLTFVRVSWANANRRGRGETYIQARHEVADGVLDVVQAPGDLLYEGEMMTIKFEHYS